MLVLSRKSGESVHIGDSIEVKVVEIGGGKVKLGFSAPRAIAIQRHEIQDRCACPAGSWDRSTAILDCCIP